MEGLLSSWLRIVRSNMKESVSEMEEIPEPSTYPFLASGIASSVAVQDVQWKSFPTEEMTLGKINNSYWNL